MIDAKTMEAIVDEYTDELKGVASYGKLYDSLVENGAPEGHLKMIREIVKDEMQHIECLRKMLESVNAFTPPAIVQAMKEAEDAHHRILHGV